MSEEAEKKYSELREKLKARHDPTADVQKYVKAVDRLFEQVRRYLHPQQSVGFITLRSEEKQVYEERVGAPYSMPELNVDVEGGLHLRLTPRGRYVIGADGRVDMIGPEGTAILVLLGDTWNIIVQGRAGLVEPRPKPLDEDAFADAFESLILPAPRQA